MCMFLVWVYLWVYVPQANAIYFRLLIDRLLELWESLIAVIWAVDVLGGGWLDQKPPPGYAADNHSHPFSPLTPIPISQMEAIFKQSYKSSKETHPSSSFHRPFDLAPIQNTPFLWFTVQTWVPKTPQKQWNMAELTKLTYCLSFSSEFFKSSSKKLHNILPLAREVTVMLAI